jgi:hypothetical protein
VTLRIALVHPEEVGGEQAGFIAARPRSDLDDHILLVVRVPRQEQHPQARFQRRQLRPTRGQLLPGQLQVLRFQRALRGHRLVGGDRLPGGPIGAVGLDYLLQVGPFPAVPLQQGGIAHHLRLREQLLKRLIPLCHGGKLVQHACNHSCSSPRLTAPRRAPPARPEGR